MIPNLLNSLDPRRRPMWPNLAQMAADPNPSIATPPLIDIPAAMPRPVMMAQAVPMLQPGAPGVNNANGVTYGQFPDANVTQYDPTPGPAGAIEEVTGPPGSIEEVPGGDANGDQGSLVMSGLSKIFGGGNAQRALAAFGVGLSGMGPQQFQNPLLQRMVMQRIQQDQQQAGLGRVFDAMTTASRAPNATEALAAYDRIIRDPSVANSPKLFEVALAQRTKMAERAQQEGIAGRTASVLGTLPEGYFQEDALTKLESAGIPISEGTRANITTRPKRYSDDKTADGQPIRIDWKDRTVQKAGSSGDWMKLETINGVTGFVDRDSKTWNPIGGMVKTTPGDKLRPIQPGGEPGAPIVSEPEKPPEGMRVAAALLKIDPDKATAEDQQRMASLSTVLGKYSREDILQGMQDRTLDAIAPGLSASVKGAMAPLLGPDNQPSLNPDGSQKTVAGRILDVEQQRKVDVARAGAETTSALIEGRQTRTEERKASKGYAVARTILQQAEDLLGPMEQKGFMSKTPDAPSVMGAATNRSKWSPWGKPGDADLTAWNSLSGGMVSLERSLGDIGPRAMAAYQGALDVINHPTTAAAARRAIQQFREQLDASEAGAAPGAPMKPTAAPSPAAPATKTLSPQQYQDIRGRGYTDEQIRAKGYGIP